MSFSEIENALNKIADKVKSSPQIMDALKTSVIKSIEKNFDAGGRPVKWEPSKKTLRDSGKRTLIESRQMSNVSAEPEFTSDGIKIIVMPGPLSKAYSRIHNEGGVINVPSRSVRHRKTKSGRTVFAKSSHKRITKESMTKPYTITIPKREYLNIPEEDHQMILDNLRAAVIQSIL